MPDVQNAYYAAKELQTKLQINDLILPIDDLATRIYSQNREIAMAVRDGETNGMDNIGMVISQIASLGRDFLLDVVGSKDQGLK